MVVVQETKKVISDDDPTAMQRRGRQLGWSMHPTSAKPMAANSASGGTIVAVRRGIGLQPAAETDESYDHRVGSAWVGGICKGGMHVVSVYMKDSEGLSELNMTILARLAQLVGGFRNPWIVGGDWNMTPAELASSGMLEVLRRI